jgi:hypothetical protein
MGDSDRCPSACLGKGTSELGLDDGSEVGRGEGALVIGRGRYHALGVAGAGA